jgi:hypothetical protein
MLAWKKSCLIIFLIAFFSIQWKLTLCGGFCWPFTSHRLFSQQADSHKEIVQAIVQDRNGNLQCVHPGRVIPIEYARCSGLVRTLAKNGTQAQKEAFCAYLIQRLNYQPWRAFDEMLPPVTSSAPIVSLTFELHDVDFTTHTAMSRRPLLP